MHTERLKLLPTRHEIEIASLVALFGKGIGAASIMASLQASLRAHASHPHFDLSSLIGDVNRLVYESTPAQFFATLFYAEYKPATRALKYVNAGHVSPVVARPHNGSCEIIRTEAGSLAAGPSERFPNHLEGTPCVIHTLLIKPSFLRHISAS